MVLGTTYYNAARSALGTRWNRTRPLLAFRNACLATLVLTAAVVAGDASSSPVEQPMPKTQGAAPEQLPLPETVEKPVSPPAPKGGKTDTSAEAKKMKAVLLPPIQSLPDYQEPPHAPPRPAPPRSSHESPSLPEPVSALAEPPPSLGRPIKPAVDTNVEVVVGQPRVLTFPDVPHRVALAVNEDDPIATLREVPHRPREWYLIGKKPGLTYLDVWLPDLVNATSHRVLHYRVRILSEVADKQQKIAEKPPAVRPPTLNPPTVKVQTQSVPTEKIQPRTLPVEKVQIEKPPTEKPRMEPTIPSLLYQALEEEINRTFPGTTVHLKQVGEMLVVSGTARNIFEATRILTLAREHAPGPKTIESGQTPSAASSLQVTIDNYAQAGGPHVVNLLRIPGEQQIMLRVVVAEVNRAAARSLGLDFGIADQQATVLPRRPGGTEGSSTIAVNGWIGQLLRTLQDLHYAQSLAEPTLTTLNGQTARFQAGGEFPIPVVSPSAQGGTVQGVAFRSYGVHLSIQPVLADFDRIRLAVDAEVSGTDPQVAMQVAGSAVPGLKVRNFQSTVELREGETLAVAGLIRNPDASTLSQNVRPGVGEQRSPDHELVVLISPLLLHPPANERGESPDRLNPQDIELYLRSRNTMVPRGDALFLIGPQGYAGNRSR
jgi:pilus assembly protein CpaC